MSSKSSKLKNVKVKPEFSPQKSYTWQADTLFAITGAQVDLLNKVINMSIESEAVQKALALVEASKVVASILKEGYEEGIVVEAEKPQE